MRLVVLGDPVDHSRSPAIHTAALAAAGIDGTYTARRVDPDGMRQAVDDIRAGRLDGANVTMPHKGAAAVLADATDDLVEATGAANTLRHRSGRVEATNTDVGGLRDVAAAAGIPGAAPVLLLGGGGAAAAVRLAFADRQVQVSVRSPEPAGEHVPWGTPIPGAVVVNATPLGMAGEPLPEGLVEAAAGLIDLAYGPGPTAAVTAAERRRIPWADGLDVLVAQAARSFTWWTGCDAPLAAMQRAARAG